MWCWGWYFQIVFKEYQHWTFPKHNYERVVTLSVMLLDNSQREIIFQEIFSCIILVRFMPQHIPLSWLEYGYGGATERSSGGRHQIAILFVGKWNDITSLEDKINFISCRLQSTNSISLQKSYCPTETKRYGIQKVKGINHIKQIKS